MDNAALRAMRCPPTHSFVHMTTAFDVEKSIETCYRAKVVTMRSMQRKLRACSAPNLLKL